MALLPPAMSLDALERRVGALCERVTGAELAARRALRELVVAQTRRYEDAVHFVYANLMRGLMHGDRPRIQACLFAGCNTLEQLQMDWNTGRMEAQQGLLAAADDLRTVTGLLTERFGLVVDPSAGAVGYHGAAEDHAIADRVAETVGRKRRRLEELREGRVHGTGPHARLVDALRDPDAAFGSGLSAAEHRLLSNILPESGLMPDLVLMRDGWHPSLCLYATDRDRKWAVADAGGPGDGPHVSTFCGLILSEFMRTRRDMQRFTFVHIMTAMGFGPPDVNHYLPFVEHTFFDRVNSDPALCFIAQAHAPPVAVFRGAEWADLLDLYAADRTGAQANAWDGARLHHCLSLLEARLSGNRAGAPRVCDLSQTPTTVLGALHRLRAESPLYLDGMGETAAVSALDDGFTGAVTAAAAATGHTAVVAYLSESVARARAWPMSLRQMAVEHVRMLVRRLRLLPRCPDLPYVAGVLAGLPPGADLAEVAARAAGWLWRLRWSRWRGRTESEPGANPTDMAAMACDGDESDGDDTLESELQGALRASLVFAASVPSLVSQVCTELDEAAIRRGVEAMYGPVTEANRTHLSTHLSNMERLVTEAFRHDRRLWTEARRRRIGMDPIDVIHDFRVAAGSAGPMYDPDDLRLTYMRAYRGHAEDAVLAADADLTGYSAMRDPAMFPPSPPVREDGAGPF